MAMRGNFPNVFGADALPRVKGKKTKKLKKKPGKGKKVKGIH